jgi:hypothetical protein
MSPPQIVSSTQQTNLPAPVPSKFAPTSSVVQRIAHDLISFARANNNQQQQLPTSVSLSSSGSSNLTAAEQRILGGGDVMNYDAQNEFTITADAQSSARADAFGNNCNIPVEEYAINHDNSPEVVTKRTEQKVEVNNINFIGGLSKYRKKNRYRIIQNIEKKYRKEKCRIRKYRKIIKYRIKKYRRFFESIHSGMTLFNFGST